MAPRDRFGSDTTTDEVVDGIDLTGRRTFVTGATSGLGVETARALAAAGASVTLTARDVAAGERVAADIRTSTGNDDVAVAELDLASLASVRRCAERWLGEHDELHVLVCNAGVMACPQGTTDDGFELQFGTNHLGHFVLAGRLAPALLAADSARVVVLSSRSHHRSPVVFDDLGFEAAPYDKWLAYGRSKTANVLFAVELDRRLRDRGVRALAVNPGVILTGLGRHLSAEETAAAQSNHRAGSLRFKTVEQGAATQVWAATAPELDGVGGVYLEDCAIADVEPERADRGVRPYALDADDAERLWAVSEDLVGERFDLGRPD